MIPAFTDEAEPVVACGLACKATGALSSKHLKERACSGMWLQDHTGAPSSKHPKERACSGMWLQDITGALSSKRPKELACGGMWQQNHTGAPLSCHTCI